MRILTCTCNWDLGDDLASVFRLAGEQWPHATAEQAAELTPAKIAAARRLAEDAA